jgi:hypothetical protein
VRDQILKQRSVQDRGDLEFLARDGGANNGENSRADHGSDSKRGKAQPTQRLFKSNFRVLAIGQQLVNLLATEEV